MATFALTITLTLGTNIITEHGPEDEILLGSQLVKRTRDNQSNGLQTLTAPKIQVDRILTCRLQYIGNVLMVQPLQGKRLVLKVF